MNFFDASIHRHIIYLKKEKKENRCVCERITFRELVCVSNGLSIAHDQTKYAYACTVLRNE